MRLLRAASLLLLAGAEIATFADAWNGGNCLFRSRRASIGPVSQIEKLTRNTKVHNRPHHHGPQLVRAQASPAFLMARKVSDQDGRIQRIWSRTRRPRLLNMVVPALVVLFTTLLLPTAAFAGSSYNPQSVIAPTLVQQIQWSCRLVTAAALGAIIGQERSGHPAGVRTMALVSMGAAMFTLCSLHGFGSTADPSRMAANVASGVGFIGAGVITTSSSSKVHGLTTAAAIWLSAAVGVGCASGLAFMSGISSLLTITILRIGRKRTKTETKKKLLKEDKDETAINKQVSTWIRKMNSTDVDDSSFRRL